MCARKCNLEWLLLALCLPATCVWCALPSLSYSAGNSAASNRAVVGHLLIPKQAGDLKMLYLKVFLHRHFREGAGWAERGVVVCACWDWGFAVCCRLVWLVWKENHVVGSGPSDLCELRGRVQTCHQFLKQLIAAPLSLKIVFSLGSKNKEMF